jgi:hypothetical protein
MQIFRTARMEGISYVLVLIKPTHLQWWRNRSTDTEQGSVAVTLHVSIWEVLGSQFGQETGYPNLFKCFPLVHQDNAPSGPRLLPTKSFPKSNSRIQNVPGGKASVLGGHSIGHSKQKKLYMYMCRIPNYFTVQFQNCWQERDITYRF